MHAFLSRYLPGSKTPISKFNETKEVRWGLGCPLIIVSLYALADSFFTSSSRTRTNCASLYG
ncbi:hypothetical protein CN272_05045 [Bacillus anthracis]|nr:hypothetical protein CUC43_02725 [Bacillus thuringiensis LM1212]OTX82544.1 hypothetical protein BK728_13335 [Bacillus thuringiensis serovar chanpaisis]OTY61322.1 hypothetical protein BK748_07140 [Bacillus thuringiensis serovar graciosensis]PEU94336.1 hypothetical protein CN415_08060 [Bacillus cereus]PFC89876.1 hypothetical protein CN272_05045 [Bacillus anthracis]PFT20262.1 hypothetical protein COK52_22460 [Bacillus thuringiensis]QDF24325.1 hypothetical protein FJR70_15335 [Bacillus tropicu